MNKYQKQIKKIRRKIAKDQQKYNIILEYKKSIEKKYEKQKCIQNQVSHLIKAKSKIKEKHRKKCKKFKINKKVCLSKVMSGKMV